MKTTSADARLTIPAPTKSIPNGHPADGMCIHVPVEDGEAWADIIDPRSFADGGPEWVMRYGNPNSIRYTVAALLASFDYLLSGNISNKEAMSRLGIMRAYRRAAIAAEGNEK